MTNPRWLNDEEQSLWRLMLAVNRKVSRGIDETLQLGSGLTSSEFAVLVNLSESPDHIIRLRDLCASLNWDRSRTSHQIIRMEKRGLVVKKRCPDDGRGVYVQLTREGEERLRSAAPGHVEVVRKLVFDPMGPGHVATLRDYLEKVVAVDFDPDKYVGG
ncbi:MarR family transcriptional regulator [Corynebacterium pseudotuberculosis]|uniref:MarR family winged helix-turn-helix transcriptional regulator n=1 Tax=Corynebacterium pseudotuberculosis TaxID=1719 RepID=UPI0006BB8168|nr:MarR family winged helix-turn-helix transcriptional regulator [Corynebacterium pseudotuberculosis]ALF58183.1 MarR family transcriptional regulator [Corynebacterium pseudotuberculosis]